jgi:hypothetical protein
LSGIVKKLNRKVMSEENGSYQKDEIFSKAVRAGKRTYFFDVKSTRGNDLYLTITESKRRYNDDGTFRYEKHKLFLYKEDFDKFQDGFSEALDKIKELQATGEYLLEEKPVETPEEKTEETEENSFSDVSFEDLDKE